MSRGGTGADRRVAERAEEAEAAGAAELFRLARLHGVLARYRDQGGTWRFARPESLRAVLAAIGVEAEEPRQLREAARARKAELRARMFDPATPVVLAPEAEPAEVVARVPAAAAGTPVSCALRTEDGDVREWRSPGRAAVDGAPDGRRGEGGEAGAHARVPLAIPLPGPLAPGYHELRVRADGEEGRTLLLATPAATWRPPEEENLRAWGVFLPLYALRSERSWGTGDLRDLERLLEWTGRLGGRTVGTLPLLAADHAAAPGRVYAPVSRLFWDETYLDVERAPELERSEEARRLLESDAFRARLRALRDRDEVDWRGSAGARREVLEILARDAFRDGPPLAVRRFLEARPEAEAYARFRAARERAGDGGEGAPLSEPGTRYHLYAQYLADRQMRALRDTAAASGAGLYLDLPVGCAPDGFDVWRHREAFARGVAVGAPPDEFFSDGQNWGFPPLAPEGLERSDFRYFVDSLRHHMRVASRLRLDHVMSLHRLFWIPDGMDAADGVYVRYPKDALHAILRIESHRHRSAVVGEDLGTVPREVRRSLSRDRIERMYVAQFEARPEASAVLPPPPARAVASLNTHDMPTFAGYWQGADIDLRRELGFLDEEEAARDHRARVELEEAWVRFLQAHGDLEDEVEPHDTTGALRGTLRHLARSRAALLLVSLEDLWLEDRPQNVPGTGDERPNFRRKASMTLEAITTHAGIGERLAELDRLRRAGREPDVGGGAAPARGAPRVGGRR